MRVTEIKLPGVLMIQPAAFHDSRGVFFETFRVDRYAENGIPHRFVQDNFSRSVKNVLRGLHFQTKHAQGKLITVLRGEVFDVVLDLRVGSPTFGQWETFRLSSLEPTQIFIPPGLAHGFCVLSDEVDFCYKCTDYYYPAGETGVLWNDADLGIPWPIQNPILSPKDLLLPPLKEIDVELLPRYEKI